MHDTAVGESRSYIYRQQSKIPREKFGDRLNLRHMNLLEKEHKSG